MHFVFDVDGTLTPSRQPIIPSFHTFFTNFIQRHKVSLVTGSDIGKTKEQLGTMIPGMVEFCFNCSGSDIYSGPVHMHTSKWVLPEQAQDWLSEKLSESRFVLRTGLHFEHRPGMCNFSIVGRNATIGERKLYVDWDTKTKERLKIAKQFVELFPDIDARVGGETGIDIFPKGCDKSQILQYIDDEEIMFFGDAMEEGGNDYPLAVALNKYPKSKTFHVENWQHTERLLKKIDNKQ
jgi:phosphomannomutase